MGTASQGSYRIMGRPDWGPEPDLLQHPQTLSGGAVVLGPVRLKRHELISANDRLHWTRRRNRNSLIRARAAQTWLQAHQQPMETARCDIWVSYPDQHRRDLANLSPTVKALIDGVVSGPAGWRNFNGILPDDSDQYLEGPYLHRSKRYPVTAGVFTFQLVFTPLEGLPYE